MKRYGGTVFPTEHTVVSLEDDQGKRIGWVSVVRDISERKRMEESLLESEAYMKNILKAAPIGIGLVHNRVISWISDPMCAMLGYSEDELIGQSAKNVYESDEEFQRVGAVKYSEIQERGVGTVETRFKRKDGSILDVLLSSSAIDPEDFNKGIIFTALDITERKLMENALKESVENFKALAENANDGILIAVGEGDHVYANRRAAEITGYSIAELVEISLHKLVVPDEVEIVADRLKRRLAGEDVPGQYETLFVRKSSESFPVELSSARTDWEGQPASIVIVRDITNRKRAEEAVRKSEVALVEKSRHLEEVNVALRILLKQREADKADLEERLLANVKELVLPYVEKLKNSRLHSDQMTLVGILESNMKEIVSPFVTKLSSRFLSLTPTEIQVASLIKDGKSSKEIASLLHASENTVRSHRFHIRSKLGIKNKKVNLRSYLQSLQD
jgi:PAS domain S-box-containing protein